LLAGPIAAQAQYNYQFFVHPDSDIIQVFGINDRGDVVGNRTDGDLGPFVYDSKKGTLTDVTPATGFASTSVLGINDAGVMVGSVDSLDGLIRSGFIRSENGTYTVFDHPDAVSSTNPRGVNNEGLVTGFRDDLSAAGVGFIYDPKSGTFTDLNPTSLFTIAQGINSKGEVVGSSNFDVANDPCPGLGNPFLRYGWLRATDGTVTYFEVNGSHTSARGINDKGSIVGFFIDPDDGIFKGYKARLDGSQCQSLTVGPSDMLYVPGSDSNFAQGISNSGAISGGANIGMSSPGYVVTPL
jgi:uncharacterized membrane protein